MKKLNKYLTKYLTESLLDDEDELVNDDSVLLIDQFLKDNYIISGSYNIRNRIVDVNGSVRISWDIQSDITELTNGFFEFGVINGDFIINDCINLKTLKGCPKKVKGDFLCCYCKDLKSFEQAPHEIEGNFSADGCRITTLKGLPKRVKNISLSQCSNLINLDYIPDADEYVLSDCIKLKSLKGLPQDHEYSLDVSGCEKLKTLEGCGKNIGYLSIDYCKLDSFVGGPEVLSGNLYMNESNIKSLEGFPNIIRGIIYAVKTRLRTPLNQFKDEFIPQNVRFYQGVNIF